MRYEDDNSSAAFSSIALKAESERCGFELPIGTQKFCPDCGWKFPAPVIVQAPMKAPAPPPFPQPAKSKRSPIVTYGGGCLSIFFLLGLIGAMLGPNNPGTGNQTSRSEVNTVMREVGMPEAVRPSPEAVKPATEDVPVSNITWRQVDAIYNLKSSATELQKKAMWPNFKGKKVLWSGTVAEVSETIGQLSLQVKMNPDTFTSDLFIKFDDGEKGSLINLRQGQAVRFTGILDDWGSLVPITLTKGKIVN